MSLLLCSGAERIDAQATVRSVVGTVRDSSGAPLSDAGVSIGERVGTTDVRGAYRIDSLAAGRHLVVVRRLGYAPLRDQLDVRARGETEVSFVMARAPLILPATIVEGRRGGIYGVVADTSLVKTVGAVVELMGPRRRQTRTDSAGQFSFSDVVAGQYLIRVVYPGFAERRISLDLKRSEGRELAILLAPARRRTTARDSAAMWDLGVRLTRGFRQQRKTESELAAVTGNGALCRVNAITSQVGEEMTMILNGTLVMGVRPSSWLCMWRVTDVALVEFGRDACAERTHSIAELMGIDCIRSRRDASRSINPRTSMPRPMPTSYVVIWEKR